ncbi:MAG: hypothetical protein H6842_04425 [Rhodospirillaceae bacterium]|nr:hypothetical protein [Rhodospirillaceae bacterium]
MAEIRAYLSTPEGLAMIYQVLALWPLWRSFARAGLRPWLSLVVLVPFLGLVAALGILAVTRWPAAAKRG